MSASNWTRPFRFRRPLARSFARWISNKTNVSEYANTRCAEHRVDRQFLKVQLPVTVSNVFPFIAPIYTHRSVVTRMLYGAKGCIVAVADQASVVRPTRTRQRVWHLTSAFRRISHTSGRRRCQSLIASSRASCVRVCFPCVAFNAQSLFIIWFCEVLPFVSLSGQDHTSINDGELTSRMRDANRLSSVLHASRSSRGGLTDATTSVTRVTRTTGVIMNAINASYTCVRRA